MGWSQDINSSAVGGSGFVSGLFWLGCCEVVRDRGVMDGESVNGVVGQDMLLWRRRSWSKSCPFGLRKGANEIIGAELEVEL